MKAAMGPATTLPKCVKVAKFAQHMDISKNTVWRLVGAGKLPCLRIGRTIVIPEVEALRVLRRPRRIAD